MTKTKVEDMSAEKENPGGKPVEYDPSFKGPIHDRGCTDIICCLLFIIFFLGMIAVGGWAYVKGNPEYLLYPTDSQGNLCGRGDKATKPYLFFFDLLQCAKAGASVVVQGCPTPQICVENCPDNYFEWYSLQALETKTKTRTNRTNMICKYDVTPISSQKSVYELVLDEDCAAYYLNSSSLAGRCVPTFITSIINAAGSLVNSNETVLDKYNNTVSGTALEESTKYMALLFSVKEYGMKIFQDVSASWWLILVFLGFSMVWCFVWIVLMRWIAGFMVWFTIIAFLAIFSFATYYCFTKYVALKDLPDQNGAFVFTTNLDYYTNLKETWLALGIIAAVFLGVILILVIFLRKRIMIAIALIKESSRAVGNMVFTLFWPIVPWVLQVCLFGYWGASAVYLASMGRAKGSLSTFNETNVSNADGTYTIQKVLNYVETLTPCDNYTNTSDTSTASSICQFFLYGGDEYTIYLQFYQLFMLFWVMNFIIALGQMTLAGAFASYYWAFKKPDDIPAFPVAASLWRCLRYHMGTLAFGALIIAIVQIIRVFLEYLDHKLKGKENALAKFLIKCLKCCFWCLEKVLKFINKNAYILTAIYGYNFCKAAMQAFSLILRNIIRVAVVDKVTDFIVFIGKLVVVGAVTVLAYYFFSGDLANAIPIDQISYYLKAYNPSLNFYLIPVIIIAVGSFVIASGFFSVYSMGVDTLFLCFLEDLERNDGSAEKPFYMSKELMKIMDKKNDPEVAKAKKE